MIAELAQDLITKIRTVPALGNRVGLAAAGGPTDPSMKTVPMPAVWVMYEGESPVSQEIRGSHAEDVEVRFTAAVMISYVDQPDLLNNQLPTLEAIARSVSGKESTQFALRWKYQGAQLVEIFDDRLVYELSFMVSASYMI